MRRADTDRGEPQSVSAAVTVSLDVNSASGLPNTFSSRIEEFATEFEVECAVLRAADDGNDEHSTILGVDLGIKNVAVTSTGKFWNGSELNHWHREFEKRRGSPQQHGTRAAHETIQSVGRTETGRYNHLLHTVSKELVTEAVENGYDVIAFENLTGIRERMPNAKKFHTWAFRRLFEYVEYKAEMFGISTKLE